MATKKKSKSKASKPKARKRAKKTKAPKRSSAPTVGALPEPQKLEPTASAYAREVKALAKRVLALRREQKGDRAFAIDQVARLVAEHGFVAHTQRALPVLMWTAHRAAGWPSSAPDVDHAMMLLAEAAMTADVWERVQAKLPAKLREPAAVPPSVGGSSGPRLRDGYAYVSESTTMGPADIPAEEWSEEMLTRRDVTDARPAGTISLYGDRLQAFRLHDGRIAAVLLQNAR